MSAPYETAGAAAHRATSCFEHPRTPRFVPIAAVGTLLLLVLSLLVVPPTTGGTPPPAAIGRTTTPVPTAVGPGELAAADSSIQAGQGPAHVLDSFEASPHPSGSPSLTNGLSMVYDAADGYVLAVTVNLTGSGNTTGWGSVVQTWTFSSGNWSQLNLSYAPPNREGASAAYDPQAGYVVLFGGAALGGAYGYQGLLNDTWTYASGTWTNRTANLTTAPSPRENAPMVWDGADNYSLLVGGFGVSGNLTGNLSSVWTFANGSWTKGGTATGLRPEGAMAYDAADGYVLYFGGTYPTYLTNESWKYRAGTWTSITSSVHNAPSARAGTAMVYDPGLDGVLLFGGLGEPTTDHYVAYNDTWLYSALNWTLLSAASGPSPREYTHLVYDAADNVTLLFGGYNLSGAADGTTWALNSSGNASAANGTGWAQAAPHLRASQANDDVGLPVTFTVGGVQGTGATFSYTGLPLGCASADTASLQCTPLATGNYTVVMSATSSAGSAVAAILLHVVPSPSVASVRTSPGLTEVGGSVTVSTVAKYGVPPFSYRYTGLPAGCGSANAPTLTCTVGTNGSFTVGVVATDSLGKNASGTAQLQVLPALSVNGVGVTPVATDVGLTVEIAPVVQGGLGPFSYQYPHLPIGCASQNASALRCQPTGPGNYSVEATLTDWLGFTASGYGQVTVNPAPAVTAFTASNASTPVNGTLTVSVDLSGGTAPFTFDYTGLPGGCVSANRSTLRCAPTAAGTYTVDVFVTDAVGVSASASVAIAIVPAPVQPSPGGHHSPPGGGGGGSTTSAASTVDYFVTGLALGLVALAAGLGTLLWRARLAREGRTLVEQLRRAGDPGGGGPPGAPPGHPPGSEPDPMSDVRGTRE